MGRWKISHKVQNYGEVFCEERQIADRGKKEKDTQDDEELYGEIKIKVPLEFKKEHFKSSSP